jgi:hypothetical protein
MWRFLRIAFLLLVLLIVGAGALLARWDSRNWDSPLFVSVFPVNADGRPATQVYIQQLKLDRLVEIEKFFQREKNVFGLALDAPVALRLYPQVTEPPPAIKAGTGVLGTMLWSLKLRWYSWRNGAASGRVKLYVLLHDPDFVTTVPHSMGLQKGLIGVVHAFADRSMERQNNIVMAHELLHTLGATDKYDPQSNLAKFPEGYGDPQAVPRYPQQAAEIMAGRRMLDRDEAQMPESLDEVVIGDLTATEINWR